MRDFDYEVTILVNGKPVTEYAHNGKTYVEGRKGSDYAIRINNRSTSRICAVTSVDGLNILTGQPASSNDQGFILNAFEEITIPGWKLNSKEGAAFTFSAQDGSYSVQAGQGDVNLGVIGVKVFKEKERVHHYVDPMRTFMPRSYYDDGLRPRGIVPQYDGALYSKCLAGSPVGSGSFNDAVAYAASSGTASYSASSASNVTASNADETLTLGTGFGKVTTMETHEVPFERQGWASATMVIHYNTRKNLEKIGISFPSKKKSKPAPKPEPQAFPADSGCKPPPGWRRS